MPTVDSPISMARINVLSKILDQYKISKDIQVRLTATHIAHNSFLNNFLKIPLTRRITRNNTVIADKIENISAIHITSWIIVPITINKMKVKDIPWNGICFLLSFVILSLNQGVSEVIIPPTILPAKNKLTA